MTGYTWAWLAWIGYFAVVEGVALYQSWRRRQVDPDHVGGTLSEHIWQWFGTARGAKPDAWAWTRRGVLGLFLLWLGVHFLSGGQII